MARIAFVFPGQGSQSVGMLGAFAGTAVVGAIVQRASEALGEDVGRMIAEGPAEQLDLTVNTQPCLLTASYAIYAAWRAAGGPAPALMAGHSLGEYTALVAADAMRLQDAVPLVRFRAQVMQEAVPVGVGTMAAILGLDDGAVIEACAQAGGGQVVEAVNFNAPAQIVIAGHSAAVARACDISKRLGAKRAVMLAVSVPFHSSLLASAADRLRARLAAIELRPPSVPVINNIDVAVESDPDRIRDALARQAAGPVRWTQIIQAMGERGVTHVIECGPGKVLSALTRRIVPGLQGLSVSDPDSLSKALSAVRD
ncbi:MAG TPA: ACP S-malonyltransferase [Burkholderiaceae bacterium]|jgi:[acyl-carrier-protein] S-malonyltransferase|nr:ACP S-malonyltransferase [Burkholderiaceae bacterium]